MQWKCWWKEIALKLNNIDNKEVCSSCAANIILFSVFLSITIGIATVLIYFYWSKRMKSSLIQKKQWFTEDIKWEIQSK